MAVAFSVFQFYGRKTENRIFCGVLKRESDAFTLLANLDNVGVFRYA